MSIALPPDLEQFIQSEVASGQFPSAEAAVTAAVRLLRRKRRQLEDLRAELAAADAEIDRGDCVVLNDEADLRAFFDEIVADGQRELLAEQQSQ